MPIQAVLTLIKLKNCRHFTGENMKNVIVFLVVLLVVSVSFGYQSGVFPNEHKSGDSITITYLKTSDFNEPSDTNDIVYSNFRGSLYQATLDLNGTDTAVTVGIYYDPIEPNSTLAASKLYKLVEWSVNAVDGNDFTYVIPSLDSDSNPNGGSKVPANYYIGIHDTTNQTLDRALIYLYGKLD